MLATAGAQGGAYSLGTCHCAGQFGWELQQAWTLLTCSRSP